MNFKFPLASLLFWSLSLTLPALAQIDSAVLHAKYGRPLNRETFRLQAGFDLIVDYGADRQACRLEVSVSTLKPPTDQFFNTGLTKQRMYEFLADLVPDSMRGKEIRRTTSVASNSSVLSTEYEHIVVNELQFAQPLSRENPITIVFLNNACRDITGK